MPTPIAFTTTFQTIKYFGTNATTAMKNCGTFTRWSTAEQKKNNDILKFAGKWMDLENIILSELTQAQKGKYYICSLIGGF